MKLNYNSDVFLGGGKGKTKGKYWQFLKINIIAPSEAGVFSTNAGDKIIKTKVGRYEAEFIFFDDPATSASLYWYDENDNMLIISGYFDKEEILKIANSIYE